MKVRVINVNNSRDAAVKTDYHLFSVIIAKPRSTKIRLPPISTEEQVHPSPTPEKAPLLEHQLWECKPYVALAKGNTCGSTTWQRPSFLPSPRAESTPNDRKPPQSANLLPVVPW